MSQKVWSQFSARNGDKLCILDAPADRMDEALNLYIDHYLAGEAITVASGIPNSAEAIAEYRTFTYQEFKNLTQLHIMLCGIDNGNDKLGEIIGVSLSYEASADTPFDIKVSPKTKEVQKLIELSYGMMAMYDILKEQKVNKSIDGMGIIVHPKYRGFGIAQEFLKARRLMCTEIGVEVTSAWMTSIGTQKAAERDGYETVFEFDFEEFGKKLDVTFENTPKTCKLMMGRAL